MNLRRTHSLLFLSVPLFLLSACHSLSKLDKRFDTYRRVAPAESTAVLARLGAQSAEVKSLRMLARGVAHKGVGKQSFRQVVVFERPDRLRLEFLATALNRLAAIIAVRGGIVQAIDQDAKAAYLGEVNLMNQQRMLSVPLMPDEMMLWFVARFDAQRADLRSAEVLISPDGAQTVVLAKLLDGRQFSLYLKDQRISAYELYDRDSKLLLDTRYQYAPPSEKSSPSQPAVILPTVIEFSLPAREVSAKLTFDAPELNPDLTSMEERLFLLQFPSEYQVFDLDEKVVVEFDSPLN